MVEHMRQAQAFEVQTEALVRTQRCGGWRGVGHRKINRVVPPELRALRGLAWVETAASNESRRGFEPVTLVLDTPPQHTLYLALRQ
jgi:hypothetical protein